MHQLQHLRSRGWIIFVIVPVFVAGHLILLRFLRHAVASHVALPGAVVAGLAILIVAKHLGLLAALFRYVKSFRRH